MYIKGIGRISKKTAMSILTEDGREGVKDGSITIEELGNMYKLYQVKRLSKIGRYGDTFSRCLDHIPLESFSELPPAAIAQAVDAYYDNHNA